MNNLCVHNHDMSCYIRTTIYISPTLRTCAPAPLQLERPPSRQKPPPEALHLWAPDHKFSVQQGRSRPSGRPQTAMASSYRRPMSGPSVQVPQGAVGMENRSVARPPSRQKPPPMSLLLEHDHEFAKRPGSRQTGGHRQSVTSSSDESETDF